MDEIIGHTFLNRYRVDAFIDRGGMADVYRGFDLQRHIPVALKFLRSDFAQDREFERRFRKEAAALDRLSHPNIVRFYELARAANRLVMVMDFVEGVTLRQHLFEADGPLTIGEAITILKSMAAALHYAHMQGIIHRDIKPGNVLLSKDGQVLLSDFGIAKLVDSATVTTIQAGTPAYMSPEQCAGRELDARSDVYSLAVLAYEMLTGRRPFVGESDGLPAGATAERIRVEHLSAPPPRPREYNPALPEEIEVVLLKALSKRPADRHASAMEFVTELERAAPAAAPIKSWVPSPASRTVQQESRLPAGPAPKVAPPAGSIVGRRSAVVAVVGSVIVIAAILGGLTLVAAQTRLSTLTSTALAFQPTQTEWSQATDTEQAQATATARASATASAQAQATRTARVQMSAIAQAQVATTTAAKATEIAQATRTARVQMTAIAQAQVATTTAAKANEVAQAQSTSTAESRLTATAKARIAATSEALFKTSVPAQLSPANGAVFDHFPRVTTLKWNAVPGAAKYRIEIDCYHCCASDSWCTDVGKQWIVVSVTGTEYTFQWVGAQPGRWRVSGLNSLGEEGPRTDWWVFSYTQ